MIPPVERSITVRSAPAEAFRRFTQEFSHWWPRASFSIGGERIRRIVFECRDGGLIFEEHEDGRRFQWGQVTEWSPPSRVAFRWHPSREPEAAQDVTIDFHAAAGGGTKINLTAANWERWGKGAEGARRGYGAGWNYVLNTFAGTHTFGMTILDGAMGFANFLQKLQGGRDAAIAKARGEITAARPRD